MSSADAGDAVLVVLSRTGESLPVTLRGGDAAQMGATVVRGETHATGGDATCAASV